MHAAKSQKDISGRNPRKDCYNDLATENALIPTLPEVLRYLEGEFRKSPTDKKLWSSFRNDTDGIWKLYSKLSRIGPTIKYGVGYFDENSAWYIFTI